MDGYNRVRQIEEISKYVGRPLRTNDVDTCYVLDFIFDDLKMIDLETKVFFVKNDQLWMSYYVENKTLYCSTKYVFKNLQSYLNYGYLEIDHLMTRRLFIHFPTYCFIINRVTDAIFTDDKVSLLIESFYN